MATSIVIRHLRGVPEQCPECGSPHLFPEDGWHEAIPEIAFERPVCSDCGWTGEPIPVGERSPDQDVEELITREGGDDADECSIMVVPLMKLKRPGDVH
jgi:hypothetical protein